MWILFNYVQKQLYNLAQLSWVVTLTLYKDSFVIVSFKQQSTVIIIQCYFKNHPTLYNQHHSNIGSTMLSIITTIDNIMANHHTFHNGNCHFQLDIFRKVQWPLHLKDYEMGQFCQFLAAVTSVKSCLLTLKMYLFCRSWSYKVTVYSNFCRSVELC